MKEYGFNARGAHSYLSTLGKGFGSVVLANILYSYPSGTIAAIVNDVGNRVLDNQGTDGSASDASMYGSNHIYLGATQSVTYTTVNTGDYAYFDVTTKSHVKATATASTTTISTPTHHSNFFSLKAGKSISAGDLTALNANPEDIARIVKGVATVGTYSFTLADIEAFYPGNEGENGGAYVQDVSVDLGADNIQTSAIVSDGTSSIVLNGTDGFTAIGNSDSSSNTIPRLNILTIAEHAANPNAVYVFELDTTLNSGSLATCQLYSNGSTTQNFNIGEKIVYVFKATGYTQLRFDGLNNTFNITAISSFREASVAEIANYTASCRDTYKNKNYGASNLIYKQDASGRLTGMADDNLIEFSGDGRYVDTGFMPPSNSAWELDLIMYFNSDGTTKYMGVNAASASNLYVGQGASNKAVLVIGGTTVLSPSALTAGLYYLRIEFDGVGNGNLVINNTITTAYSSSTYSYSALESFFLGATSRLKVSLGTSVLIDEVGKFQYTDRSRTVAERNAYYAELKTIYPTLP